MSTDEGTPEDDPSEEQPDEEVSPPGETRRPTLVYAALGAGAVVLAILLLIVWLSSRDDSGGEAPLCLDISLDDAEQAVLIGDIEQIDVLLDSDQPLNGLTAIQMHMTDGECRRLPEGADSRPGLYQLLGVVSLYNEEGEQRVDVNYQRQEVPLALMQTSTPIPTATSIPTETQVVTETATGTEPAATATAQPSPANSPSPRPSPVASPSSPVAVGSPLPSPVSSPGGSPVAEGRTAPEH